MSVSLNRLLTIAIPVFAVCSMASVGFRYTFRQIAAPLRSFRGVALALLANFILVPLLASLIARFLAMDESFAIGLILAASAAGSPFVLRLVHLAGGDLPLTAGILVLLVIVTIVSMPYVVPRLAAEAAVNTSAIAKPLVMTMLLPLSLALILENLWPGLGERIDPALDRLTTASLIAVVGLTCTVNLPAIVGVFRTGAIPAALLLLAGAFVIGYAFGGFSGGTRGELGFNTAQRNYAAALVVARDTFNNPDVLVMVVATSVVSIVVLFPAARVLRRHLQHAVSTSDPIEMPRRNRRAG